jgi:enediyne biosynthesis protein E4
MVILPWRRAWSLALLLVAACSKPAAPPPTAPADDEPAGPPWFEDRTSGSGLDATYKNGEEAGHFAIIESVGGGVALIDYDNDGLLDVFVPGGGFYEGKQARGHPCKLFRNLGGLKFEDVSKAAGVDGSVPYSHGASAFDYDNDGWTDLLVSGYNRLVLLHNEPAAGGGRRFADVTQKAGLTDRLWSTSTAWGDLDGDGFPEIYVCHYGDWGFDTNHPTDCVYDGKTRDVCQPRRFQALPDTLYRNNRNGTFTDVSDVVKVKTLGRGLGVQVADLNGDARPDVYVANDTDDNFLFANRGTGKDLRLEEIGLLAMVARDDRGVANGSMGVDAADFDRTGRPSIIVTNYENELPALYQPRAGGRELFNHATQATGLSAVSGQYVSWGTGFHDFDLDGWEDLYIVSGHAIRFPTRIDRRQKANLFRNTGGRFKIVTRQGGSYFETPHNARGSAVGDLDNDGRLDLVVCHLNEPLAVLRNVALTDDRHWVGFDLVGKSKRCVVGARVTVATAAGTLTRFVKGGGSFASTGDRRLHFGVGPDAIKQVTVQWPWGESQEFAGLTGDRYWTLTEGEAGPR